jgi:hypothetical protein
MRRTAAALALLLTLPLAAAACSAPERGPAAGPTPSAAASPGASPAGSPRAGEAPAGSKAPLPTAKAGGNGPQVCSRAQSASEKGTTAYIDQLSALLQAQGTGDDAGARAAQDKLNKGLDTWAVELRRLAGTAEDFQLKTALGEMAAEVERMEATIDSVDDGRLGDIQDRLDALCPA